MNARHHRHLWGIALWLGLMLVATAAQAQSVSIKNNLLYDATLTPNLGLEVKTGRRSTLQLFYGLNPWKFSGEKKLRHWSLMPEYRLWLSRRGPFEGTFAGIHAVGGEFNVGGVDLPLGLLPGLEHNRYEGWYVGGGLTIGHAWRLSCRWKLEAALGVGYLHGQYDKYVNEVCGDLLATRHRNYVGPTKLALNLAYVLGGTCKKPAPQAPVEVPTPTAAAVAEAPTFALAYIVPQAEAEKARTLSGSAFLDFPVNQIDIRPDYRGNSAELAKVDETINVVKNDPNVTITHVDIHGYASPEGSYQNNVRLAKGRAQTFKDYVRSLIALPEQTFSVSSTPEDWDGLVRHLQQPNATLANARQLLAIATSAAAPDDKERRMKTEHPADWKVLLRDVLPALRHSDYTVSYTIRPFTVDEAKEILKTKPQQLSLGEMFLVAQTYEPGSDEFEEVFLTAVRHYPDDPTANLNAAIVTMQRGDLISAERYLLKAGNTTEAEQARQALKAKQENPDTQINIQK